MFSTWAKRSQRFYTARHVALGATVALTTAILCAALLTGHSLHEGLRRGLSARLGAVRSAAFFPETAVPLSVTDSAPGSCAALLLNGELLNADGDICAAGVQIIGVQGLAAPALNTRGREVMPGREGFIRFRRPSGLSVELPLGSTKAESMVRRAVRFDGEFEITRLLRSARNDGDIHIPADFALYPSTLPPVNVFVPYDMLAEAAGLQGQANLFVSRDDALQLRPTPEDIGLEFDYTEDMGPVAEIGLPPDSPLKFHYTEDIGSAHEPLVYRKAKTLVKSKRIFLPRTITVESSDCGLVTSHLVDSFDAKGRETPYGFVMATPPLLNWINDDQIIINEWLAKTLDISAGASLTLRWRRITDGGKLEAVSRTFRVNVTMTMYPATKAKVWMPEFPGMEGVDSCADWDVGLPMDEEKLNDPANEAYWKEWRETPKAFITYAAGTNCFGTVFGDAMCAIVEGDVATVRERVQAALTPEDMGMVTFALAEEGARAAGGSTDFSGLFVGMAFVLVVSALMLTALTLSLVLETRKQEVALLSATGWPHGRVLRLLVAEWWPTLLVGASVGTMLGKDMGQGLVWGLGRFWSGAFAGAQVHFYFSGPIALASMAGGFGLSLVVLVFGVRRLTRQHPARLWQASGAGTEEAQGVAPEAAARGIRRANVLGSVLTLAAIAVLVLSARGQQANAAFFGAGALLLVSLLLFVRSAAGVWRQRGAGQVGAARAGVCRAVAQMPRRGMAVTALLAVGTFLVIGCLAMKHDPVAGCAESWSGSGGFAAVVTSAAPFERERGLAMARRVSGARQAVPVRVKEGDLAGCLNMNAPTAPQVVGLDARAMARMRAFEPRDGGGVWSPLMDDLPDGTIPALAADRAMLEYSLKAKAGAADGTCFRYGGKTLRVVGVLPVRSGILQGSLIVDERHFTGAFPEAQGYRMWLCDYAPYLLREMADPKAVLSPAMLKEALRQRHPEPGVAVETVEERLRLLGAVESTYLDMFLVLGGLGMVLGVFGVALVILRGIEERRAEFAVLNALGIRRRQVGLLIAAEYGVLVVTGLAAGILPALIAIQPAAHALGGRMPWGAMAGVVAALLVSAAVSVAAAAWWAAKRFSLEALNAEGGN